LEGPGASAFGGVEAIGDVRANPPVAGGWRSRCKSPSRWRQGGMGENLPKLGDFSIKIMQFYAYYGQIAILKQ